LIKMRTRKTVVLVLLAVLSLAAPAAAQQVNAPPGNSGVDEYLETVPGAGGNRPSTSDTDRSPLSPGARAELERQGPDGRAAAELAEREGSAAGTRDKPPVPAVALPRGNAGGEGGVATLGRAVTGSSEGMGLWLPTLLALSALGALAAVMSRRSRRHTTTPSSENP